MNFSSAFSNAIAEVVAELVRPSQRIRDRLADTQSRVRFSRDHGSDDVPNRDVVH